MSLSRVVVTGLGVVTPFGRGAQYNWDRLIAGDVAITAADKDQFSSLPSQVIGVVPQGSQPFQVDLHRHFSGSELRSLSRASCLVALAADDAALMADWRPDGELEQISTAVCIGMGMSDLADIESTSSHLQRRGARGVSPYFGARILLNMPAGVVARRFRCRGPTHTASTACATGCHSIGDAFRLIRHGHAKRAFAGSVDTAVGVLSAAAFSQMRALSCRYNAVPQSSSRPFDTARDGFVLSEGAGVLLLEELQCAVERGGRILAEIRGYGMSGDADHPTAPRADGDGALRAMSAALEEANIAADSVGHVNAHATGTALGDRVELEALVRLVAAGRPLVTSCKGALGHLLGGAGSVELAMTIKACQEAVVPATANLCEHDPVPGVALWRHGESAEPAGSTVKLVAGRPAPWKSQHRVALKNSFGFGGTNACLCLTNFVQ